MIYLHSDTKMELNYMKAMPHAGGFNYDNCLRNKALNANLGNGLQTNVQNMKTGTTICGLVFKVSHCLQLCATPI